MSKEVITCYHMMGIHEDIKQIVFVGSYKTKAEAEKQKEYYTTHIVGKFKPLGVITFRYDPESGLDIVNENY